MTLPNLWCRTFHNWKPSSLWHPNQTAAWQRATCRRCALIDLPTPADSEHPEHP